MHGKWIWFYGDYEIYHSLMLHSRRQENGYFHPPFWKLDDCRHNVKFIKNITLEKDEDIIAYAKGIGTVTIDGNRYPFEEKIHIDKGNHIIEVLLMNTTGLPCLYIDGETVFTDETWQVSNRGNELVSAGCNDLYTSPDSDPLVFSFAYRELTPLSVTQHHDGMLYDFGKETFAKLVFEKVDCDLTVYFGESLDEVQSGADCYLRSRICAGSTDFTLSARAFRYILITAKQQDYSFRAFYEYLPVENKASFRCSDEMINKIWETALYTLELNSREFYLDGIKRDRWVWSGDAYQSYLLNRYSFFDPHIIKRTILALRGKDPMQIHINTIMDYSFYWIISIGMYYEMTGDIEFVKLIYPKMKSLMEFCFSRLDENGFATGIENDWIFIDWADIEKNGAVCAEQMLFLKAIEAFSECSALIGENASLYNEKLGELKEKINKYFWNSKKGAFIDSFATGNNHVTRHANIFAVLFGYADAEQKKSILENVIFNDSVAPITTPYFKFFELDLLCSEGYTDVITQQMKDYWGGMLNEGATSFWEEYDPKLSGAEHYAMYGEPFHKSLCHAWGASPVYLIGRYYLGVKPTSAGYETFEVNPQSGGLEWFEGSVPVNGGSITASLKDGQLTVTSDKNGGILRYNNKEYKIEKDIPLTINA